jgi:hypothetical protein
MQNKTEVLKQKKGVSLNAKQSEAELACAEEEVRRLVKKGLVKYMVARGLPERGNATIINWAQAMATALTEALEDVFGRVVVSTPETVSQFVALKTEYTQMKKSNRFVHIFDARGGWGRGTCAK